MFSIDDNFTLPFPQTGEDAGLFWAIYTAQPPLFPSPNDTNFTGILLEEDFISETNTNGIFSTLPNGLNLANNTRYIIPVTSDDGTENGNPNGHRCKWLNLLRFFHI